MDILDGGDQLPTGEGRTGRKEDPLHRIGGGIITMRSSSIGPSITSYDLVARLSEDEDIPDPIALPVPEPLRYLIATVRPSMPESLVQLIAQEVGAHRVSYPERRVRPRIDRSHPIEFSILIDHLCALRILRRHPMVRDEDQIDLVSDR